VSDLGSQTPFPAEQAAEQEYGTRPAHGPSGPRAGFWRRFGAMIVDGLILAIPSIILVVAVSQDAANILSTLIGLAYYTYFEGGPTGQTLGKRALGIRVYDFRHAGGPIGYGRGLLRYIARILSTIPLFLGYFWMLWDKEKQTWHDKIAGSVVVPVDAYPVQR
jgi:uncharacterized RDD family membrane protein YckC